MECWPVLPWALEVTRNNNNVEIILETGPVFDIFYSRGQ